MTMPHQLLCRFQSYARRVQANSKRPSPRMRRSPKARHLMHLFEKHRQATGRESTGPQLDKGPGSLEIRAAFYQPLNRPRQGSVWVSKKFFMPPTAEETSEIGRASCRERV